MIDRHFRPIPGEQVVDSAHGMAVCHAVKDVFEIGERLDVVELGGGDERADGSPPSTATVGAREQVIFAPERNLRVMLPISGRMLWSDIAGIRCTDSGCVVFRASGAHRVSWCMWS